MGIFRRLRAGSTTTIASPVPPSTSKSTASPATPPAPPTLPSSNFPTPTKVSPSRPSILPSPSSGSIAPKTKKTWGSRWKGKEKEKPHGQDQHDGLGGTPYEESLPPLPAAVPAAGKRDTMIFIGRRSELSPAISPASTFIRKGTVTADPVPEEKKRGKGGKKRKDRVNSGEFQQDGAILGRLGFEIDVPSSELKKPLKEKDVNKELEAVGDESAITIYRDEAMRPSEEKGAGRVSDEIEILESAEKKQRFWRGRTRRSSRAASEMEEDLQPGSPTPRKTTLPGVLTEASPTTKATTTNSTDIVHPRPQTLRRPSSSLFHNPFNRSMSRTSLALDLDGQAPSGLDDGSFQLRGFRHVSGIMDVEGAGGLEDYLTHVPRESMIGLDRPNRPTTPDPASPISPSTGGPPSAFGSVPRQRTASRAQISRPPSVAASLASVDDIITNSNRISAAAFRKGIRRPSEGPGTTMSDIGHGTAMTNRHGDEEEEDNLPLGLLKPRDRNESSYSLSSMREEYTNRSSPHLSGRPSPSPSPQPQALAVAKTPSSNPSRSPSPQLVMMTRRQDRQNSSFVVKSARSSRVSEGRPTGEQDAEGERFSPVLLKTLTSSPNEVLVESPPAMDGGGYFSHDAPRQTSVKPQAKQSSTALWLENDKSEKAEAEPVSTPPPISLSHTPSPPRPTPPPVQPIDLPQVGDITPLDLPLPPDLMPDTPPKVYADLPPRSLPTSPSKGQRRMSLLDEPLRVISGLFSPSIDGPERSSVGHDGRDQHDDGFDPDLVVVSMTLLGEDAGDGVLYPKQQENEEVEPRPISRATLFDAQSVSGSSRARSPLQTRLSDATTSSSLRPVFNQTSSSSSLSRVLMSNQGDDTTVESRDRSPIASSFARVHTARPPLQSNPSASHLRGRAAWSSSESDGESDSSAVSKSSRRTQTQGNDNSYGKGKGKGKGNAKSAGFVASPGRKSVRQVPGGPRRASIASTGALPPQTRAILRQGGGASDSSSSEDENLSVVIARASQSSLSMNKIVSPPSAETGSSNVGMSRSNQSTPSLETSARPSMGQRKSSRPTVPKVASPEVPQHTLRKSPKAITKSPPKVAYRLAGLSADERARASPESSLSATSESLLAQPSTPRDFATQTSSVAGNAMQDQRRDGGERRRSVSTAQQQQPWPPYDPSQAPLSGVDHAAMIAMMKQAWQAQFMAAAYRASEEEWERASAISGPTATSPSPPPMPSSVAGMPFLPPMQAYGYPPAMTMPPWMPYHPSSPGSAYGPPMAMPISMQSLQGGMQGMSPSGSGMYGFGASSQSVFGGEFGPPSHQHQTRHQHQHQGRQSTSSGYMFPQQKQNAHAASVAGYDPTAGAGTGQSPPRFRGGAARTGSESMSPRPPSSWRNSGGDVGQWDDAPTPRKLRPATQLIN